MLCTAKVAHAQAHASLELSPFKTCPLDVKKLGKGLIFALLRLVTNQIHSTRLYYRQGEKSQAVASQSSLPNQLIIQLLRAKRVFPAV